ncbi:P-loop containing nucleoside triphosphate hydrolase protein [Serendipita vermifera]|nr:P-loop containing nucleoside triphosphate hydrolase protein [Serendipita vermifera]
MHLRLIPTGRRLFHISNVLTRRFYARPSTPTSGVQLRDYQENCIKACLDALSKGTTRIGVSMPTGTGKTTVFVSLLHRLADFNNRPAAKSSLIIVNSVELAIQAVDQIRRMFPQTTVEIEQGKRTASGLADVTVATYQTLTRGDRLDKFLPERTRAIIVDEAHHAAAKSYLSILSHFDPVVGARQSTGITSSGIPIIGFSATFGRHDGRALGSVFQEIVYHSDFLQMIKEQWLCNVRFTTVKANIDLSDVAISQKSGDFVASSLAQVMNTEAINSLVVQSWLEKAENRKTTLVFCANLAHVHDLTNEFRQRGVDARYIHAGTHSIERQKLINDFKAGLYPVLVNCSILTEGADIPNIDCVVLARPTRSRNIFAQMIGRGMRLSSQTGKEDCHILDFVDTQGRVAGMFSTPTLFGLDPNEILPGSTLDELIKKKEENAIKQNKGPGIDISNPDIDSVTYEDYEDPFSWQYQNSKERHINTLSPFAWVASRGSYILECMGKGSLRLEPLLGNDRTQSWEVVYSSPWDIHTMKMILGKPIPLAGRSRRIALSATLPDAVAAADSFAKQKLAPGNLVLGLMRNAQWRRAASTPAQHAIIAKSLGISLEGRSEEVAPEKEHMRAWCRIHNRRDLKNITKGAAADMITRLRRGAKGAYDKELKKRARISKELEKEEARRRREIVQVGPLKS